MKLNVVAYLSKERTKLKNLVDIKNVTFKKVIYTNKLKAILCIDKTPSNPEWLKLFSTVNQSKKIENLSSVRGILVTKVKKYYVVYTFGHGRSLINKNYILRGFGLRVAMNMGSPNLLKSIDKSALQKVVLQTRSQSSKSTGVEDFDFEFDHEIIKSITAIVDSTDDLELVSGSDSVSLYTDVSLNKFQTIAERLFKAFNSKQYKTHYPWAEYISPEMDPLIRSDLNDIIITKLNKNDFDDLWIAPPKLIDYRNFSGFSYIKPSNKNFAKEIELNLDSFMKTVRFKKPITFNAFNTKKIYVLDSEEKEKDNWSCFTALNGEVEFDSKKYILNDGMWYKISDDFYIEINDYFNSIEDSELTFPDYGGLPEGLYLVKTEDETEFLLLDQKWVKPAGVSNNLEFCDLITRDFKNIIHVKKYGSSALLNHLFAQATQSIEMLTNSPEVLDQLNEHLNKYSVKVDFDPKESPRKQSVVLAIMDEKDRDVHMPFFAKVNLRHHVRKMKSQGFEVYLAKIDFGEKAFDIQKTAKKYDYKFKKNSK